MRELCCYLLIPELPLEHRSGSVSRSAPCTGTLLPADRKARLASHKEANIEEHFLSQRGFVRRTRSNLLSWQGTVTNTYTDTHFLAHLGGIHEWLGFGFSDTRACMNPDTHRDTFIKSLAKKNRRSLTDRQSNCNLCSSIKTQLLNWFGKKQRLCF